MENNPKKSKAFIITFILILLLLLVGYYLFTNRNKIFDAKGSTSVGKIFAPLLGTSKNKGLNVIDTNTKTNVKEETITGIIITDQAGNKIIRAEAGENLKKGDVLYISSFNSNKDPIVMKAIASDKNKSLVFGVAGEDIKKGEMGNIIIEGVLTGVPTNKNEGTLWLSKNPLYLSDKIYGGMTKNAPFAPNFVVVVGSVLIVHPVNGSIRIGGGANAGSGGVSRNINSDLLNNAKGDLRGYLNSIFNNNGGNNGNGNFNLNPINLPGSQNSNFPNVTVTAAKSNIKPGEATTISWTSTKTTSCNAGKGNGTGVSGSFTTGALTKSTVYSVTCVGPSGSGSGNAFVIIDYGTGENNLTFPIIKMQATPSTIKSGEESLVTWESTNTTACTLSGGGLVGTGVKNLIPGVKTGKLTKSMSYSLTCTGKNKESASESVFVFVDNFTDNGSTFPIVKVDATPSSIKSGEESTITWSSINATACTLSGGGLAGTGVKNTTGVKTGKLTKSMVYSVKCTGTNGSIGENAYVDVAIDDKLPTITLSAVPSSSTSTSTNLENKTFKYGKTALISWKSTNTTSCESDTSAGNNSPAEVKQPNKTFKSNDSFTTPALTSDRAYAVTCTGPNGKIGDTIYIDVSQEEIATDDGSGDNVSGGGGSGDNVSGGGGKTTTNNTIETNSCNLVEQNPLVFNEDEKARLAVLIRKFYLVSSTLRTAEDLTTMNSEIDQNKNFINQTLSLTKQCYLETNYEDDDMERITVSVSAFPQFIKKGEPTTIVWSSTGAAYCSTGNQGKITKGSTFSTSGEFQVGPLYDTKAFNVTCSGVGGEGGNYTNVIVTDGLVVGSNYSKVPGISIEADPSSIKKGEGTTITWRGSNMPGCGGQMNTGPLSVPTSFTKTCSGPNGTITGTVFVPVADGLGGGYNDFCVRNKNLAGCYKGEFKEKANASYKSMESNLMNSIATRHGNPWFTTDTGGTFPYTKENNGYLNYSQLEGDATPAGYKVISGYYYGTLATDATITNNTIAADLLNTTVGKIENILFFGIPKAISNKIGATTQTIIGKAGESCDKFNTFQGYGLPKQINDDSRLYTGHYDVSGGKKEAVGAGFPGDSIVSYATREGPSSQVDNAFPRKEILEAGCSWKDGVILDNTERLLKIW